MRSEGGGRGGRGRQKCGRKGEGGGSCRDLKVSVYKTRTIDRMLTANEGASEGPS